MNMIYGDSSPTTDAASILLLYNIYHHLMEHDLIIAPTPEYIAESE